MPKCYSYASSIYFRRTKKGLTLFVAPPGGEAKGPGMPASRMRIYHPRREMRNPLMRYNPIGIRPSSTISTPKGVDFVGTVVPCA